MSNENTVICRRVEDDPNRELSKAECGNCHKPVFVEPGLEGRPALCIYCAVEKEPNTVLFVELQPDEFGRRSMSKGAREVLGAADGEWHKQGEWHDPQYVLNNQE
jgi:hypothetical protein